MRIKFYSNIDLSCYWMLQEIEKYLQDIPDTAASMKAAYICSCNKWYDVAPCGFPMQESICCICGKRKAKMIL